MFALQRLGDAVQRHQGMVSAVQWAMVVVYVGLVLLPPFLPAAPPGAPLWQDAGRLAEVVFWGVWWPGIVLSMLLVGQFWCGLLCPDGTLSEFASRHGAGRKVAEWMRWPALPLALFVVVSLYDQLIGAHHLPAAAALVIGGTTLSAVVVGAVYGKGKRVFCRYLCPVSGVFSLLSRAAVLHFRVDRAVWDAAPRPAPKAVDCPPLLDVRRLISNEKCNMCCRCSGHRGAVALAVRPPGSEIASLADDEVREWEALGIIGVLGGLLVAVAQWPGSWWYEAIRQVCTTSGTSPWWIAGGRPWGEALALLLALIAAGTALAAAQAIALLVGAGGRRREAARLAYALIPLAGLGLLLSSLEHALALAAREGWPLAIAVPALRWGLLGIGASWSLHLAWRLSAGRERRLSLIAGAVAAGAVLVAAYLTAPISGT